MGDVDKRAGYEAAKATDVSAAGPAIQLRAKAIATSHRKTGAYIRGLKVGSERVLGVKHTVVTSTDPASEHIEKGTKRRKRDGTIVRIPGQHILLKTQQSFVTGG